MWIVRKPGEDFVDWILRILNSEPPDERDRRG